MLFLFSSVFGYIPVPCENEGKSSVFNIADFPDRLVLGIALEAIPVLPLADVGMTYNVTAGTGLC